MKKILITGGLGYIGTELCKIYSGQSSRDQITVIDNSFFSERVSQLKKWGINFHQCDILDKQGLREIVPYYDVIIHLAGITDVPYTKSEENLIKEEKIKNTGLIGTANILSLMKKDAKIIFPSTHVIFEGISSPESEITEDTEPNPVLTYSRSKFQSEKDIINSGFNYIILRLASVYGYSGDATRASIVPNLFSKISAQGGKIKLFSKGVQLKSLVSLIDVVRCFKFMEESGFSKEIFNVSNENISVKEIAQICKKFSKTLAIEETDDEIPNLGYAMCNKKLLSSGFKFLYSIEESIKEMIYNWSDKNKINDIEYIKNGEKEFVDKRGSIVNYELPEPINLIGLIKSKAGSVRANHYHPVQEQKCLLISGKYISVTKDLLREDTHIETRLICSGDLAVIRPNVAHTMVFLEDSIFLNLVRGEREHENYGITHTIPYVLVDEKFRLELIKNYSTKCRACGNEKLAHTISLGLSPLANNLLNSKENCEKFPLEMKYCEKCNNAQLSYIVPPEEMFNNYYYTSSTAASFRNHFSKTASDLKDEFNLNERSLVVDIGSNDGVLIKPFNDIGVKAIGVEPAKNLSEIANKNGFETINSFFDSSSVDFILSKYGKADIVTAFNVFAHSDKLQDISENVFRLLKEDGSFVIEVQYLLNTLKDFTFDNIYHEHVNYWSINSLIQFFSKINCYVNRAVRINTHGGSIRVFVSKINKVDSSVTNLIALEKENGMFDGSAFSVFNTKVNKIKSTVYQNIVKLKQTNKKIYGYGSPAKATTALNYFGVTDDFIDATIEDNNLKVGKVIPGVNIPIISKQEALQNPPNLIIVFAWNFFDEIKKNNKELIDLGVEFVSIKDLENE